MRTENGKYGEDFAVEQLIQEGYTILTRNYYTKYGELDIVAQQRDILAFIEVKTRSQRFLASPIEAVDYRKRQRIIKSAILYLQETSLDLQPRFDMIGIVTKGSKTFEVISYEHIPGAFDASEYQGFC